MDEFFRDKVILVTGAAGSVGQELVRQLLAAKPAEVRALDNNETELFYLGEQYREARNLSVHLGDVRDPVKLEAVCQGVQVIFHAAAFKHVGMSEYHPSEAVRTNVQGVENILRAAVRQGVERVVFTSSDKAVNPTTVMGTTKLLGERLVTAASVHGGGRPRRFSSVRFGNVIGSRGSVVAIFREQIRRGGPVTVTDPDMTRFFMTLEEAVKLVLQACVLTCGGEVFVTKMPVIRIRDLAEAMILLLAPVYGLDPQRIPLRYVGPRPGEKLGEGLLTEEERSRAWETEGLFIIPPALGELGTRIHYAYRARVKRASLEVPYHSAHLEPLTLPEIMDFLRSHRILGDLPPAEGVSGASWEGRGHLRVVREASGISWALCR